MPRHKNQNPTDKELAILKVLWHIGPATVRQVNDQICKTQENTGYTTTLKIMQIMTEKGQLLRDESVFKHIYTPALSQEDAESQLVGDMIVKVFAGSADKLVMRALSSGEVTPAELKKIRQLLDSMDM